MPLITIALPPEDLTRIMEALESHEYWGVCDESMRRDGYGCIPGEGHMPADYVDEEMPNGRMLSDIVAEVKACRALSDTIHAALRCQPPAK